MVNTIDAIREEIEGEITPYLGDAGTIGFVVALRALDDEDVLALASRPVFKEDDWKRWGLPLSFPWYEANIAVAAVVAKMIDNAFVYDDVRGGEYEYEDEYEDRRAWLAEKHAF